MPTPKKITICGVEYRSIRDAAKKNGIPAARLQYRIEQGWPESQLLDPIHEGNPRKVTIQGVEYKSIADAARKNGLAPATLVNRLNTGVPENRLLDSENILGKRISINGIIYKSIRDAAKKNDIPEQVLYRRIKDGDPEDTWLLPPVSHSIVIAGATYDSIAEAARKNGLKEMTLRKRMQSNMPESEWLSPSSPVKKPLLAGGRVYESRTEAAYAGNISKEVLSHRLKAGWAQDELLQPLVNPRIQVVINNHYYSSLSAASIQTDINYKTLQYRISHFAESEWTNPTFNKIGVNINGKHYTNYAEASRDIGVSKKLLYSRVSKGCNGDELFSPSIRTPFKMGGQTFGSFIEAGSILYKDAEEADRFRNYCVRIKQKDKTLSKTDVALIATKKMEEVPGSNGELVIDHLLRTQKYEYRREETLGKLIQSLQGTSDGRMRIDFTIYTRGKLLYCIEYDGIQHFRETPWWGMDGDRFAMFVMRDKRKSDYIRKVLGVPLLRIRYDQNPQLVLDAFKKNMSTERFNPFLSNSEYWAKIPIDIEKIQKIQIQNNNLLNP